MSRQITIKKEIKKIRDRILPPKDIVVIFRFPISKDASHGKYGGCKFHVFTGETEPLEPEEELEGLREHYNDLPEHCRKPSHKWSNYEKFLEDHECKCGKEHPYHNPEYRQQNKWG